jgi:uncharacterized delta-60 repeat protein
MVTPLMQRRRQADDAHMAHGRSMRRHPRFRAPVLAAFAVALAMLAAMSPSAPGASSSVVVTFDVSSSTTINPGACANGSNAVAFGTVQAGTERLAAAPCEISFGSSNNSATLHMTQADRLGSAMHAPANGALDPGFGGGNGFRLTNVSGTDSGVGTARSAVRTGDGGYVFAGSRPLAPTRATLTKLDSSGNVDTGFGGSGTGIAAVLPTGAAAAYGYGVFEQPDGKLVLTGYAEMGGATNNDFVIARLLADGTPDPGFGPGGVGYVTISLSNSTDIAVASMTDDAGRIVVAGWAFPTGTFDAAVLRLLPNGTLDTTFGTNGSWIDPIPATQERLLSLDIDSQGRIIAGGEQRNGNWDYTGNTTTDIELVRLDEDGDFDPSFNGGAKLMISTSAGLHDAWGDVLVDTADRIVLTGAAWTGTSRAVTLLRLDGADGSPDGSFAPGGRINIDPSATTSDYGRGIFQDDDGSYLVGGYATPDAVQFDTMFARVLESGSVAAGSPAIVDANSGISEFADVLLPDGDGGVTLVGTANPGAGIDYLLVRFPGILVEDFGDSAGADWTDTGSFLGACLESLSSATAPGGYLTEDADNDCTASDLDPWVGIGTSPAAVARAGTGVTNAIARLRFGVQVAPGQKPARYSAAVSFDVVAPAT